MTRLRVFVADDHEVVRAGVRGLIEDAGWEVCGEASTGLEAAEGVIRSQADVAVVDLAMPRLNGLEVAQQVLSKRPATKVLLFTMHADEETAREARALGISGWVLKSRSNRELVAAIEAARDGKTFFELPEPPVASDVPSLTRRELQVVRLIAEGKTTKEIATELGIHSKTAGSHRLNAMRKLDLHSVSDVVRYAVRHHVIEP